MSEIKSDHTLISLKDRQEYQRQFKNELAEVA